MEGLSGFALAGYLNDLERQKKKAASAIDIHSKSMNASEDYQGAQKRTDSWLASLSPEDLAKVDPSTKKVASNFEGVGDVSRFDADRSARDLGLTSTFASMPEVQAYFKSNQDVLSKKKDAEINKALEDALSEMNRNKQAQSLNELEEQAGVPKGNYNLSTPRDIATKYQLPKYEDKRIDNFMSNFVANPEKTLSQESALEQRLNQKDEELKSREQLASMKADNQRQLTDDRLRQQQSQFDERLRVLQSEGDKNRASKGNEMKPEEKASNAQNVIDKIDLLVKHPGFKSSVGAKGLARGFGLLKKPVGGTNDAGFEAEYNALRSMLTMENIGKLKGVLSDTDMKILTQAASSLDINMPESDFKRELSRVRGVMSGMATETPATTPEPVKPTSSISNVLPTDKAKRLAELRAKRDAGTLR